MPIDPKPSHTALEAIRVAIRGGPPGDVVNTISAEINDLAATDDEQALFAHLLEALAMAALMAAATIERCAKAEKRTPNAINKDLRKAYEGFAFPD